MVRVARFMTAAFAVLLFFHGSAAALSQSSNELSSEPTRMARQVVDQLMNIENDKADKTIRKLEQHYPDYPLLAFIKIAPLWAKAEATYDEQVRIRTLHVVLDQLVGNIELTRTKAKQGDPEWKLSLGLSQAFSGLAYMRLGEWLKAYDAAKAGRDTLREVIRTHPEMEDAYFVLGFYEYYTGSVPFYLSWLAWLVDMSGDRELGLRYIERAIDKAPIFSPEATRLFLVDTRADFDNACRKQKLAGRMAREYPNNEQFPWVEKKLKEVCDQSHA